MTKLHPFYKLTVLCYQYSDSTGNDNDTDSLKDYIHQTDNVQTTMLYIYKLAMM